MKLFGGVRGHYVKKTRKKFIIPICVIIVLAAGALYISNAIRPPEITNIDEETAFYPGEHDPDDEQLGAGTAPKGFTNADRKKDFYTFLIFGLDSGVNTDTIIVASYDDVKKEANLISIPRDSLVNVKRTIKKINAAYPSGTLNGGGRQGGVDQLKREIKTIIGFVPDFYICVNLDAFVKIVDAVGGVEVDVPINMKYRDPTQNLSIDLKKGVQELNGKQALHFSRYRRGGPGYQTITDYQRIENQQAVIGSLLQRLLKAENILKIPEFIKIFSDNVFTDLDLENITWFAGRINSIRGAGALVSHTIPTTGTSGLPNYYELLDEQGIVELVNSTVNPYNIDITSSDLDILSRAP